MQDSSDSTATCAGGVRKDDHLILNEEEYTVTDVTFSRRENTRVLILAIQACTHHMVEMNLKVTDNVCGSEAAG